MVLVAQVVAGRLPKIAGCQIIKLRTKEPGNIPATLGGRRATTCTTSTSLRLTFCFQCMLPAPQWTKTRLQQFPLILGSGKGKLYFYLDLRSS